jgi:hypothetical protein
MFQVANKPRPYNPDTPLPNSISYLKCRTDTIPLDIFLSPSFDIFTAGLYESNELKYSHILKVPDYLFYLYDIKLFNKHQIHTHNEILLRFKHLYYKTKLRNWLYKYLIQPIMMKKYHPNYLLQNLTEDDDLEEILANWK